jgi:effector-binding domain-containing protein
MRLLKWLFIITAVVVLAVVGIGLLLPDKALVKREITIEAPPATVFTVINGFRQFNHWSPWFDLDPNAAYTYTGPLMGVGAKSSWISQDPSVGAGSQEIVESEPYTHTKTHLVFDGFSSDNYASMDLSPQGEGTHVVWTFEMDVQGDLMGRYFALLTDRMVGGDYERGLAKLKAFVEGLPKADFSDVSIELVDVDPVPIASVHGEASSDQLPEAIDSLYGEIEAFMKDKGLAEADAPRMVTHALDEASGIWQLDAAIPLDQPCTAPEGSKVQCGSTYGGAAIRLEQIGPYDDLKAAYADIDAYKQVAGLLDNGDSWEEYLNDPDTTPTEELATAIYWPVK